MSTNDLFTMSTTIDPEKDYTAELVGEGKKFKEVRDLARSKVEADLYIDHLKQELAEAREDALRRKSVEEAIAALQNTNSPSSSLNGGNTLDNNADADEVALNEDKLKQLIRESVTSTIETERAQTTAVRNLDLVKATLEATWGKEFPLKLKQTANELGVTEQYISDLAKTQPKVLFKLIGIQENAQRAPEASLFSPTTAGINTAALASNRSTIPEQERYSFWQKVRKENPTYYHSPKASVLRFEAAKKHGEAFYAN